MQFRASRLAKLVDTFKHFPDGLPTAKLGWGGEPLKAGPRLTRVNDVCHCSSVCMSRSRWPNVRTCECKKKEKDSFVAILVHEKVSR